MAKSISDNHKKQKRGRPKTTGITPLTGVRLSADLEAEIRNWASKQADKPTKAEAIRRLLSQALMRQNAEQPPNKKAAYKASELASRQIEDMADKSLPPEEYHRRKRRLIRGPKEFREIRSDQPKTKSSHKS